MLNRFSCIALAGVATEYILYGYAEGGLADINQVHDVNLYNYNFLDPQEKKKTGGCYHLLTMGHVSFME